MLASASCSRLASAVVVKASANGSLSTRIVKTACVEPVSGMKVCLSWRKLASAAMESASASPGHRAASHAGCWSRSGPAESVQIQQMHTLLGIGFDQQVRATGVGAARVVTRVECYV